MTPECGRARTDAQPLEQLGSTSSAGRSPTPRGPSSPSSAENDKVDVANALLRRAGETLVLPVDVVIAERAAADAPRHDGRR